MSIYKKKLVEKFFYIYKNGGIRMRIRIISLLIILFICLFSYCPRIYANEKNTDRLKFRIDNVVDLNELKTDTGETIELYGISTELFKEYLKGNNNLSDNGTYSLQIAYKNGILLLDKLLKGKEIEAIRINDKSFLVEINGININQILIQKGYAQVSRDLIGDNIDTSFFIMEDEARENKVGLWRYENTVIAGEDATTTIEGFEVLSYFPIIYTVIILILFILSLKNIKNLWIYYIFSISYLTFYFELKFFTIKAVQYLIIPSGFINIVFILFLIAYHNSKSSKKYFYKTLLGLTVVVITVISIFAGFYYNTSNNQQKFIERKYILSDRSLSNEECVIKPKANYLEIPKDDYMNYIDNQYSYFLKPIDSLYFSSVTFFTVGYGDIVPKGNTRYYAMAEMLLGYILQTVIFALIISTLDFNSMFNIKTKITTYIKNLSGKKKKAPKKK